MKESETLGFIAPNGEIYSCEFFGHRAKAVEIIEEAIDGVFYGTMPEQKLHDAGWASIYRDSNGKRRVSMSRQLTPAQIRTIKSELLWDEELKFYQLCLVKRNVPIKPLEDLIMD